MIPTLLVLGAIAGVLPRGWLFIFVAAVGWPVILWIGADIDSATGFLGAGALGAANAAVGVVAGLPLRFLASRIIHRTEP